MFYHEILKERFHLLFGGNAVDRNGVGFTEKVR